MHAALKLSWKKNAPNQNLLKLIILIADAPAHGYFNIEEDNFGKND